MTPRRVHRMQGELGPAGRRARLRARARPSASPLDDAEERPSLDLVVLGIGPDGHVASLFPGAWTLDVEDGAVCLGVEDSPKPPPERITLSLAVLRAARSCLLLATGRRQGGRGQRDARRAARRHVPASLLATRAADA